MKPQDYEDLLIARRHADNEWTEFAFDTIPRSLKAQVLKIGLKSLIDDGYLEYLESIGPDTPEIEGKQS